MLLTDGMFSHDGGIAPLKEYLAVLPGNGMICWTMPMARQCWAKRARQPGIRRSFQAADHPNHHLEQGIWGLRRRGIGYARTARRQSFHKAGCSSATLPCPCLWRMRRLNPSQFCRADKKLRARLNQNMAWVKGKLSPGFSGGWIRPARFSLSFPRAPGKRRLETALLAAGYSSARSSNTGGPESGYFRFAISSEHTARQLQIWFRRC